MNIESNNSSSLGRLIKGDFFEDSRGFFMRLSDSRWISNQHSFKQCSLSFNPTPRTLRGLHFADPQLNEWKIVTVLRGSIFDVLVDVRPDSHTKYRYETNTLDSNSRYSLIIQPGIAHGFLTMSSDTLVHYAMTESFNPEGYFGLAWNDPKLKIEWPNTPMLISKQDMSWPLIHQNA